jgi:hypothetical protein
MQLDLPPWARQALVIGIAFVLFLVNGAEAAQGFLAGDLSMEILGSIATVLSVALGWMISTMSRKE